MNTGPQFSPDDRRPRTRALTLALRIRSRHAAPADIRSTQNRVSRGPPPKRRKGAAVQREPLGELVIQFAPALRYPRRVVAHHETGGPNRVQFQFRKRPRSQRLPIQTIRPQPVTPGRLVAYMRVNDAQDLLHGEFA